MKRTVLLLSISVLAVVVLAAVQLAEAQQPKKIYRIGYLSNSGRPRTRFKQAIRKLGYVEGRNYVLEHRFSKGKLNRLPELAAELLALKVDILITEGVAPTRAAKEATSTIPIVMANASDDPVRQGLVASLARPGGNITGYVDAAEETAAKRMELLKEAIPNMSRVGILWQVDSPAGANNFKNAEVAARVLGLQPQSLEVRQPDDLENAFRAALKGHAEALYMVMFGGVFRSQRARVLDLEVTTRLPAMYTSASFVRRGGLMSYSHDSRDQFRRVTQHVDKILKGADPGLLPVERPTKFNLVINLKTAKQLGITIPPEVLYQATKVIK